MRTLLLAIPMCFMAAVAMAADLPKVGDVAPEFEMTGTDGKVYKTKDFVGKQAVVIAWYPRAFTGGCTKECKSFKEASGELKDFQVAYFTASTDPVDYNTKFAESLGLDYPILSDPEGKNAKSFGVLRPDGKAANRVTFVIGSNGKLLMVDDKVKTESHAKDIVGQLEKLGVPRKASK
ncbi:MAG: peroxiredoxin [Pirellulaceae bacterium]|nr:peroxiredoxin [Pirellulaceae bacterium]